MVFIKANKEGTRPKQVNPFLEAVVTLQGGKKLAFVFLRISEARERGQGKPKSVAPLPETHSKAVSQGRNVQLEVSAGTPGISCGNLIKSIVWLWADQSGGKSPKSNLSYVTLSDI